MTKHVTTSRRAILAGAAALPALAVSALANEGISSDQIIRDFRELDPNVRSVIRRLALEIESRTRSDLRCD